MIVQMLQLIPQVHVFRSTSDTLIENNGQSVGALLCKLDQLTREQVFRGSNSVCDLQTYSRVWVKKQVAARRSTGKVSLPIRPDR